MARVWTCGAVVALSSACCVAAGDQAARARVIDPDRWTQGDWVGRYGSYFYILCGARAPRSIAWRADGPIGYALRTGSPDVRVAAWRSGGTWHRDRRVPLLPRGSGRRSSCWDDRGEKHPLGKGPNAYVDLEFPEGSYLLSLYFFEVDWIQYRHHRVSLLDRIKPAAAAVCATEIGDFYDGAYVRVVLQGPVDLSVLIERMDSANAVISGIFADRIEARPPAQWLEPFLGPAAAILRRTAPRREEGNLSSEEGSASPTAPDSLLGLAKEMAQLAALAEQSPLQYLARWPRDWRALADRAGELAQRAGSPDQRVRAAAMRIYAADLAFDFRGRQEALRALCVELARRCYKRNQPGLPDVHKLSLQIRRRWPVEFRELRRFLAREAVRCRQSRGVWRR